MAPVWQVSVVFWQTVALVTEASFSPLHCSESIQTGIPPVLLTGRPDSIAHLYRRKGHWLFLTSWAIWGHLVESLLLPCSVNLECCGGGAREGQRRREERQPVIIKGHDMVNSKFMNKLTGNKVPDDLIIISYVFCFQAWMLYTIIVRDRASCKIMIRDRASWKKACGK